MKLLPREQEKLLKELEELESRNRKGIKPELVFVIFTLIVLATISFGVVAVNDFYNYGGQNIIWIFLVWGLLVGSLFGCYKGHKLSYFLSTLTSISLNLAFTYVISVTMPNYENLCLVADIFVLVLITALFVDKGYLFSTFLVILKNLFIYFFLKVQIDYIAIFVDTIIILTTGTFMLMIMYLLRMSENARMAMIRAELLALQNQELISSWEMFFKKP